MPVGTAATVKAMTADAVRATGANIVLGNTYHLMLRPGAERIARLGGLRRFMDWPGPILTDSGGFQVMSLAKLRKLDADGVTFQSHLDGSQHRLTPERVGRDPASAGCDDHHGAGRMHALPASLEMKRARLCDCRCAGRSGRARRSAMREGYGLFGIVQGSVYPDLREQSAPGADGYRFRWLRGGRPGDRRRPGHDACRA